MSEQTIIIHGMGAQGEVVASAARMVGWRVYQTDVKYGTEPGPSQLRHIAIGDNADRKKHDSVYLISVIHPQAFVAVAATVGGGTFVGPGAVIHIGATVGRGAIINTGAIVEHDCVVGDWAHISSGAVLCGGVSVGEGVWVGAQAVVKENISIYPWAVIGCGAAVIKDITEPGTYVGVPARRMKQSGG